MVAIFIATAPQDKTGKHGKIVSQSIISHISSAEKNTKKLNIFFCSLSHACKIKNGEHSPLYKIEIKNNKPC